MSYWKVILGWLAIAAYLVASMSFVNKKADETLCHKINITILDSNENKFISSNDIMDVIDIHSTKILGSQMSEINTLDIEKLIKNHSAVSLAQSYTTIDGQLFVDVKQRKPIVRIIDVKNNQYYLDNNGVPMDLSRKYASHVIIANGNIPSIKAEKLRKGLQLLQSEGTDSTKIELLKDIYKVSKYIYEHEFWRSQFVQLYIDTNREIELIPRVGSHIIVLGSAENFEYKLRKLEALYLKGLNTYGWNNYETINLKYSNQVICTKR